MFIIFKTKDGKVFKKKAVWEQPYHLPGTFTLCTTNNWTVGEVRLKPKENGYNWEYLVSEGSRDEEDYEESTGRTLTLGTGMRLVESLLRAKFPLNPDTWLETDEECAKYDREHPEELKK